MSPPDAPRERAIASFAARFGAPPELLVRAPGRVNLIGEHTDYNDGFVLPMALEQAAWIALTPRDDGRVRLLATDLGSGGREGLFDLVNSRSRATRGDVHHPEHGWLEYPRGVAWALQAAGHTLRGFDAALASDVPSGAGLSSSAAVEMAVAAAFAAASNIPWEAKAMARSMQQVENLWVGVQSGIMDQLISAAGVAGHALLIDCRDLSFEALPLPTEVALVVLDTGTRRTLVGSAYDDRRASCQRAAESLGVPALRDATSSGLQAVSATLDPVDLRRARHVIAENQRTLEAAEALKVGDTPRFGALMNASHASLRDDFEVSSTALNALVNAAQAAPGCFGARMTGAGFGGCAVALVATPLLPPFIEATLTGYATSGKRAAVIVSQAAAGASPMTLG